MTDTSFDLASGHFLAQPPRGCTPHASPRPFFNENAGAPLDMAARMIGTWRFPMGPMVSDGGDEWFETAAAITQRERHSLYARLRRCPTCCGHGTLQDRPDSFGQFAPCSRCEGLGVLPGPGEPKR